MSLNFNTAPNKQFTSGQGNALKMDFCQLANSNWTTTQQNNNERVELI